MKKLFLSLLLLGYSLVVASSLHAKKPQKEWVKVPYAPLKNYFVRNDAPHLKTNKFTSEKMFGKYFGIAAFMGKDGEPTPINFKTHFVIPIILPETNKKTAIKLKSLTAEKGKILVLRYKVKVGKSQSYTTIPMTAIKVSNEYKKYKIAFIRE